MCVCLSLGVKKYENNRIIEKRTFWNLKVCILLRGFFPPFIRSILCCSAVLVVGNVCVDDVCLMLKVF